MKEQNATELLINLALEHGFWGSSAASCPIPLGKAGCALAGCPGDPGAFHTPQDHLRS